MLLTLYPKQFGYIKKIYNIKNLENMKMFSLSGIIPTIDPESIVFDFGEHQDSTAVNFFRFIEKNQKIELMLNTESDTIKMGLDYKIDKIAYNTFYNFVYDEQTQTMSVLGCIAINNQTGSQLNDIAIQIVASQDNDNVVMTLDGFYQLPNNQITNIVFLSKNNIPTFSKMVVPYAQDVAIDCLTVKNETPHLGDIFIPGAMNLYFKGADGVLKQIGNDQIDFYLPEEDMVFEIGLENEAIDIKKTIIDDNYIIDITNNQDKIAMLEIEINTLNQEVTQSNVQLSPDENGITNLMIKMMPFTSQQINYSIKPPQMH